MPDEPVWKILIADDNPQNVELVEAFLAAAERWWSQRPAGYRPEKPNGPGTP